MKALKWIVIIIISLMAILFAGFKYLQYQTKKSSPEETITYKDGDLEISVYYNRPYKKGRVIFGELVPYNKIWRTGANEPTTFSTNKDIRINGQPLAAGKYSIFTIPGPDTWQIKFNTKEYSWGLNFSGESPHEPAYDALLIRLPSQTLEEEVEQLTMKIEKNPTLTWSIAWDKTLISVEIAE